MFDCGRALLGRWPVLKCLVQFIWMKVIQNEERKKRGSTIFQGTIKPSEKHYSGYGTPLSCDIKTHTTV